MRNFIHCLHPKHENLSRPCGDYIGALSVPMTVQLSELHLKTTCSSGSKQLSFPRRNLKTCEDISTAVEEYGTLDT